MNFNDFNYPLTLAPPADPSFHLFSETSQHLFTELAHNRHLWFQDFDSLSGQVTFYIKVLDTLKNPVLDYKISY